MSPFRPFGLITRNSVPSAIRMAGRPGPSGGVNVFATICSPSGDRTGSRPSTVIGTVIACSTPSVPRTNVPMYGPSGPTSVAYRSKTMRPTGRCAPSAADGEVEAVAMADVVADVLAEFGAAAAVPIDDEGDRGAGAAGLHAVASTATASTRASRIASRVRLIRSPGSDYARRALTPSVRSVPGVTEARRGP